MDARAHLLPATAGVPRRHRGAALGAAVLLCLFAPHGRALAAGAEPAPLKIAVFEFELEDVSAAGVTASGEAAPDPALMRAVTAAARRTLADSKRYELVDTGTAALAGKSLRDCGGCDAAVALQLGADQSLVGVVTRVAKTEYYVSVRLTDARTGKVLNEQSAFFTGADDAWASGTSMLLKHQLLATQSR